MSEQTIIILKPDVFTEVERDPEYDTLKKTLGTGDEFYNVVKSRIEGLEHSIISEKREVLSDDTIDAHYDEHRGVPEKFNSLMKSMAAGESHVMLIEGEDSVSTCRNLIMEIRAEYLETPKVARKNMTHASANLEDANREKQIHFGI